MSKQTFIKKALINFNENGFSLNSKLSQNNDIADIVNNAQDAINKFNNSNSSSSEKWNNIAQDIGSTDKELISYLKTCGTGEATTEGFAESLKKTAKSSNMAAVGFKVLNTAINALAFAAITAIITATIKYVDDLIHSVDIAKEKMEESVSAYTNTKNELADINSELETQEKRIEELLAKDKLTYAEEGELKNLRKITTELELQRVLKEKEANRNARQAINDTVTAYSKEFGDNKVTKESINDYISSIKETNGATGLFVSDKSNISSLIAAYKVLNEQKEQAAQTDAEEAANYAENAQFVEDLIDEQINNLQKYKDALSVIPYDELSSDEQQYYNLISDSIKNAWLAIDPTEWNDIHFNDIFDVNGIEKTKDELIELSKAGKLDEDTIAGYSKLNKAIEESGLESEDGSKAVKLFIDQIKILASESENSKKSFVPLSKEEVIANINALSEGFESLDKIMSSIKDKNPFDYSLLDDKKFKEAFSGLGDIYTDFIDTVSSNPKDLALTQEAFNNLVTAWLDGSGALEGLSEETAHVSEAMLTNMGITNANEIVTLALAKSKAEAAGASSNLVNASADEIVAFINTGIASDEAKEALARYALQKITTNGISLTTDGDIENVRSLVKTIGGAVTALDSFNRARQGLFDLIETSPFYQAGLDPASYHPLMQVELEQDAWEHKNAAAIKEKSQAYAESLKDAQKDVQAILSAPANYGGGNKTNKPGTSPKEKKAKDPTEFDWMEQKITLLDTQIDKLKDKIDILVGYKGKNSTTNTAIDLMVEKMSILQQMHDKYIESANAIGLSQEYVEKIQNGTIEIESVSDENLAKQLKQYQELYKNAENCSSQIDEVTKSIHELNLSKLDNIITQFSQTLDIQNQILDTEKQILDLREKSGEAVYADDYNSLIERQLNLTRQNLQAYKELSSEMAKLNLQEGSEEWKKYNDQLQDYKNNMLAAADAVEQYKDAMTELVYKELNDFKSAMDSVNDTISTMNTLIGNTNLVDESGKLTDRGLAQVALYAQQLANSKQEAAEYAEAIQSLDEALDSGLITQDEYNSMLYEYTSAQNNAVKASKDAKDAILALVKEGIQAEIDAKKKLVDETKAALEAEQNLHDYQKSITEKQDNISRLQRAIASITSTDRESLAKKLQLQNELNKAMDELNETQYQHELEERKKALDDEYTSFEESKQKEIEELDSNLDSQEAAIKKYLEDVKNNYSSVYDILSKYGDEYSLQAIDDLTKPWESGSGAADLCSDAIGNAVSNINYEISNIDTSPLWDLVDALNSIGEYGYGSKGKANFEDISNTGKWQKGKDGKWWFGEDYREDGNYNYASGGIYSINGKQYGFDDDGYMQTEWQEHNGKQYYFDANDGHMVKSQWIPGKDGKQYYLLSDGTLAKDLAVKNENDYYYVNEAGTWDGSTLTEEEVKALGYKTGYKNGTPNATQGWHLIDENGIGSEVVITNEGTLRQFEGGEAVFNNEQVRRLWDLTNNPEKYIKDLNSLSVTQPDFSKIQPVHNTVQFNAPLFKVEGGLSSDMVGYIDGKCDWLQKNVGDLAYKDLKHKLLGK